MKKKNTNKKDNKTRSDQKKSHHPFNFVLEFQNKTGTANRAIVNALDSKNAIRIGINRYCRVFPEEEITRVRVAHVYEDGKKRIESLIT